MTSYVARLAFALGQPVLNTVTFPNGRRVRTTLERPSQIETFERAREDYGYLDYCERYGMEPHLPYAGAIVEELEPVPGSPYALWKEYEDFYYEEDPEIALAWEEMDRDQARRDEEMTWHWDEIYSRLERPRKQRQAPLPSYHYKRWGHGNAKKMLQEVDRSQRFFRLGNYARYPRPSLA